MKTHKISIIYTFFISLVSLIICILLKIFKADDFYINTILAIFGSGIILCIHSIILYNYYAKSEIIDVCNKANEIGNDLKKIASYKAIKTFDYTLLEKISEMLTHLKEKIDIQKNMTLNKSFFSKNKNIKLLDYIKELNNVSSLISPIQIKFDYLHAEINLDTKEINDFGKLIDSLNNERIINVFFYSAKLLGECTGYINYQREDKNEKKL